MCFRIVTFTERCPVPIGVPTGPLSASPVRDNSFFVAGMTPVVAINWNAQGGPQVDFPIGIGLNKTMFLGQLPVRFGVEYQYYLTSSGGVDPKSALKFSISSAVPAALLRNRR